jgi:hypothetical protein
MAAVAFALVAVAVTFVLVAAAVVVAPLASVTQGTRVERRR